MEEEDYNLAKQNHTNPARMGLVWERSKHRSRFAIILAYSVNCSNTFVSGTRQLMVGLDEFVLMERT